MKKVAGFLLGMTLAAVALAITPGGYPTNPTFGTVTVKTALTGAGVTNIPRTNTGTTTFQGAGVTNIISKAGTTTTLGQLEVLDSASADDGGLCVSATANTCEGTISAGVADLFGNQGIQLTAQNVQAATFTATTDDLLGTTILMPNATTFDLPANTTIAGGIGVCRANGTGCPAQVKIAACNASVSGTVLTLTNGVNCNTPVRHGVGSYSFTLTGFTTFSACSALTSNLIYASFSAFESQPNTIGIQFATGAGTSTEASGIVTVTCTGS